MEMKYLNNVTVNSNYETALK